MIVITFILLWFFRFMSRMINPRFRIVEYQDDYFYIEGNSAIIPFLWHRGTDFIYNGNIYLDVGKDEDNRFLSYDSAKNRLDKYNNYKLAKKVRGKRKKILKKKPFDQKESSRLIEELKTAKGERIKSIIKQMEDLHE